MPKIPTHEPDRWALIENTEKKDKIAPILTRNNASERRPGNLDHNHLLDTLTNFSRNAFVRFLQGLFPNDPRNVLWVVKDYFIGSKDGYTVFPTINKTGKVCKAKLIKFDTQTGKRIKDGYSISSLEAKLKKAGKLAEDFETDKSVFFGEHLLRKYPDVPVAIVEAEKSAIIGSLSKGIFRRWFG